MRRMLTFAGRNARETLRDPLTLFFGVGFPVLVLLLLSLIQANIPVAVFEISHLAPGIIVFGFSFLSLFSATLIAKDRTSSLMLRLFASPLTAVDFICGYVLPMLPMAAAQAVLCLAVAVLLGLGMTTGMLWLLLVLLPCALLFIAIGLLCGSLLNDKQVGGICGALLTNLTAWLSGAWFDVELVGGLFAGLAGALPFLHAVKAGRAALAGNLGAVFPSLYWVIGYAAVIFALAVWVFRRKMRG